MSVRRSYPHLADICGRHGFIDLVADGSVALAVPVIHSPGRTDVGHPTCSMAASDRFWHSPSSGYRALRDFLASDVMRPSITEASSVVVWSWRLPHVPNDGHARAMTEAGFSPDTPSVVLSDRGVLVQRFRRRRGGAGDPRSIGRMARYAAAAWRDSAGVSARAVTLGWDMLQLVRTRRDVETAWAMDAATGRIEALPHQTTAGGSVEFDAGLLMGRISVHTHSEVALVGNMVRQNSTSSMMPSAEDLALLLASFLDDPGELPVSVVAAPEGLYTVSISPDTQRLASRRDYRCDWDFDQDWDVSVSLLATAMARLMTQKISQTNFAGASAVESSDAMAEEMYKDRLSGYCNEDVARRVVAVQLGNAADITAMMHVCSWFSGELLASTAGANVAAGSSPVFVVSLQRYPDICRRGGAVIRWSTILR